MGARPYNPDRPCVIGLQWQPIGNFATPLQTRNALGVQVTATTADDIDTLYTAILDILPLTTTALVLEVLDITNGAGPPALPDLGAESSAQFQPAADYSAGVGAATYGYNAGAVNGPGVTAFPYVDQLTLTPGFFNGRLISANKFLYNIAGQNFGAAFKFSSIAGSMAGRWITRVRVVSTVSCITNGATNGSQVGYVPFIVVGGAQFFGNPQAISSFNPDTIVTADWYVNPVNGMPWTPADIDLFDSGSGGGNAAGFMALGVGNSSSYVIVEQVALQVFSGPTELRLAIGILEKNTASGLGQGWSRIRFRDPADGTLTDFTLTAGNTYLFMLRETRDANGSVGIIRPFAARDADGAAPIPAGPPFISCSNVALDPVSDRPLVLYPADGTLAPLVLHKLGGGISADSQPYAWDTAVQGGATGFTTVPNGTYHFSEISFGQSLQQQFTVDTLTTFGYLAVVCSLLTTSSSVGSPLTTPPPLVVTIKRVSDDAVMAGPFNVQVADLSSPVTGWQTVGIDMGAVALAADQYYFEFTSIAAPPTAWQVQVAIGGIGTPPSGPPTGTDDVTWGAGIDELTVISFSTPTVYPANTALAFVGERPAAVTGFTATPTGESACHIEGIDLTWDPAFLTCGSFGYYDIQRSDDGGTTWFQIAAPSSDSVSNFTDWESRRGGPYNPDVIPAAYRIRVVRFDGTPSVWSATVTATATQSVPGLLFVSNVMPDYNVFYPDLGTSRKIKLPKRFQVNAPLGRNYQIVLHNLEYQGRNFSRTIGVKSAIPGCPPQLVTCDDQTLVGDDVFFPMQRICMADLPYVCVHDEHGDRYFAGVNDTDGTWRPLKQEVFTLDIIVVEVTDVPYAPDVTPSGS